MVRGRGNLQFESKWGCFTYTGLYKRGKMETEGLNLKADDEFLLTVAFGKCSNKSSF